MDLTAKKSTDHVYFFLFFNRKVSEKRHFFKLICFKRVEEVVNFHFQEEVVGGSGKLSFTRMKVGGGSGKLSFTREEVEFYEDEMEEVEFYEGFTREEVEFYEDEMEEVEFYEDEMFSVF